MKIDYKTFLSDLQVKEQLFHDVSELEYIRKQIEPIVQDYLTESRWYIHIDYSMTSKEFHKIVKKEITKICTAILRSDNFLKSTTERISSQNDDVEVLSKLKLAYEKCEKNDYLQCKGLINEAIGSLIKKVKREKKNTGKGINLCIREYKRLSKTSEKFKLLNDFSNINIKSLFKDYKRCFYKDDDWLKEEWLNLSTQYIDIEGENITIQTPKMAMPYVLSVIEDHLGIKTSNKTLFEVKPRGENFISGIINYPEKKIMSETFRKVKNLGAGNNLNINLGDGTIEFTNMDGDFDSIVPLNIKSNVDLPFKHITATLNIHNLKNLWGACDFEVWEDRWVKNHKFTHDYIMVITNPKGIKTYVRHEFTEERNRFRCTIFDLRTLNSTEIEDIYDMEILNRKYKENDSSGQLNNTMWGEYWKKEKNGLMPISSEELPVLSSQLLSSRKIINQFKLTNEIFLNKLIDKNPNIFLWTGEYSACELDFMIEKSIQSYLQCNNNMAIKRHRNEYTNINSSSHFGPFDFIIFQNAEYMCKIPVFALFHDYSVMERLSNKSLNHRLKWSIPPILEYKIKARDCKKMDFKHIAENINYLVY